jgi:galactose mutarotase-like enzyme
MKMPCHHRKITRDEQVLDCLTDDDAGMRIEVNRRGAELVSLARRNSEGQWIGFLYRDGEVTKPASGWGNHATVMGYYIHRLKNERTYYRGAEMRGGTHSFLRHKKFDVPQFDSETKSLVYRLTSQQIAAHEYPLQVDFRLTYSLSGGTLRVTFRFENRESELPAHVSFGLHPGFAAASLDSCEVLMPSGIYTRHLAPDNFLSGEVERIEFQGGPMPFAKTDLPGSFLLGIEEIPAPIFVFADRSTGRQVMLNYAGAPSVTLWSDGGPFICIEPCWGLPDHHEQRAFEAKLGIQEIAPGEALERSFTIAPQILA